MTDDSFGDDPNETLRDLHERVLTEPKEVYKIVSSVDSISDFDDEPALNIIGLLVDTAGDTGKEEGLNRAMDLAGQLLDRELKQGHQSRIHYYLGNAHSNLRQIKAADSGPWWWENDTLEREIYHFRMALDPEDLIWISDREACQIYTNLGNALSETGRFIEALRCWNLALQIDSSFGPAK